MKVYKPGHTGRHKLIVAPGVKFPCAEFLDANGKPRQIEVLFVQGVAEVEDTLGAYLIDHGYAARSPILLAA